MNTVASENAKRRIVVGVDFDEPGEHALLSGFQMAHDIEDAELHLVHVLKVSGELHDAKKIDKLSEDIDAAHEQLEAYALKALGAKDKASDGHGSTVSHIRLGDPVKAIHQVAVDIDADFIVVGTHARRGVEKLLLGSVAEELIKVAHLPVIVAHPKDFAGIKRSDKAEAARPGEDLHSGSSRPLHLLHHVSSATRISGLP